MRAALCLVLLMLFCGPLQARVLRVVGTHFPGIYEQADEDHFSGLGPAVLEQVAEALGGELRFELHPWARAQRMVELGAADVLVGPYRSSERERRFIFAAKPFYQDRILFYVRADRAMAWRGDYHELAGRRVGVVRGWVYGSSFEQARGLLQPVTVENVANGLRMLAVGRLDLLASNQRNTAPYLAALDMHDTVRELMPLIDVQRGYFAFPRDDAHRELRERFDEAFGRLVESGALQRLAAPYAVSVP